MIMESAFTLIEKLMFQYLQSGVIFKGKQLWKKWKKAMLFFLIAKIRQ